ncbi:MAG TPA: hypothetical protein VMT16_07805 [Thermoanaerobaculia bacterium]|nr:hypothetical protein [Thermoanaerobaculia bacterium]
MYRKRSLALLLLVGLVAGCGGEQRQAAGRDQQIAELRAEKQQLDAKRQELTAAREELAALEEQEGTGEQRPALEQRIGRLEEEVDSAAEQFGGELVGYINSLEILQGEPLTEEQREAIRMKSEEDLHVAREWIEKGGDYRRAIEIYESQLSWDPDYEALQQALAEAEERRYMTEERFSQVRKGMTPREVRDILGPVNLHNVVEYPEKNVEAWFYPKQGGGAAGVYFQKEADSEVLRVYQLSSDVRSGEQQQGA